MVDSLRERMQASLLKVSEWSQHPERATSEEVDKLKLEFEDYRRCLRDDIDMTSPGSKSMKRLSERQTNMEQIANYNYSEELTEVVVRNDDTTDWYFAEIASESEEIQQKIAHLRLLYVKLAEMVAVHGELVMRIDRNVGGSQNSIDIVHREVIKYEQRDLNRRRGFHCGESLFFRFMACIVILLSIAMIVDWLLPQAEKAVGIVDGNTKLHHHHHNTH